MELPVSHTFVVAATDVNIPIPPDTIITFAVTFTKPGAVPVLLQYTVRPRHAPRRLYGRVHNRCMNCRKRERGGVRISGYEKLEQFESRAKEDAPAVYRFSGVVALLR